jgi:hypothetical protein
LRALGFARTIEPALRIPLSQLTSPGLVVDVFFFFFFFFCSSPDIT